MSRSKQKGTWFETAAADYLNSRLPEEIERRTLGGTKDRGDIAGVRINGKRTVVECKSCAVLEIPKWLREAEAERLNDGAAYGIVLAKRKGIGKESMGEQLVCMTLDTLIRIMEG